MTRKTRSLSDLADAKRNYPFLDLTTVGNTDGSENVLMTYTMAADELDIDGKGLKIVATGSYLDAAKTKVLKFYFGSTVITLETNGLDAKVWIATAYIFRTGATTQKLVVEYHGFKSGNTSDFVYVATPAETLSGAVIVKFTAENTTDATADVLKQDIMMAEFLHT